MEQDRVAAGVGDDSFVVLTRNPTGHSTLGLVESTTTISDATVTFLRIALRNKASFDGENLDRVVVANLASEPTRYGEGGTVQVVARSRTTVPLSR